MSGRVLPMHSDLYEVTASSLPDDAVRINALTGNDEIKLCVDARGAMHDLIPSQGRVASENEGGHPCDTGTCA